VSQSCIILPIDCQTLPWEYVATFDVMGTDPPYSRKVHTKAVSCSASAGESLGVEERDFGFSHLTPQLRRWLGLAAATVRTWSLLYTDLESTTWLRLAGEAAGAEYIRTIPWIRWSQPQMSGDRPPTGAEEVVLFHRQQAGARGGRKPLKKSWQGPGNLVAFMADSLRGDEKYSAEKPLDDALRQVSYFSEPGAAWFDPCAGRATYGRACQILGRRYGGCEQFPEAYERATQRLSSPLSASERERTQRFISEVGENATRLLEQTSDGPQAENARRRCHAMLSEVERARTFLQAHQHNVCAAA
jgi:hypothetical protein